MRVRAIFFFKNQKLVLSFQLQQWQNRKESTDGGFMKSISFFGEKG